MPRPCPKCQRLVADARKNCIYCGTVAPPVEGSATAPAPPPPVRVPGAAPPAVHGGGHQEPRSINAMTDVLALVGVASAAFQRGDGAETARLMSRVFVEISPDSRRKVLGTMTEAWLRAVQPRLTPSELVRAGEFCQRGIAAAAEDRFVESSAFFVDARGVVGMNQNMNPTVDMLAVGAMEAAKRAIDDKKREEAIKDLVERASRLLVTPGKTGEGVALMREALELLPDPPITEEDRVRAERIRRFIAEQEGRAAATVAAGEIALALPAPSALDQQAWNAMGEDLMSSYAKGALECFENAIAQDPTVAIFWRNKASALLALGAPQPAVAEAFAKATQRSPGDISAWVGLASVLQQDDRFEGAIAAWDAVLGLEPGAAMAREHRAFCVRAAALVAEGAGWDAAAWLAKGSPLLEARAWQLADFCFSQTLKREPHHLGGLCAKGIALYQWALESKAANAKSAALRFSQAAGFLREALALAPANQAVRTVLGLCEAELRPPT